MKIEASINKLLRGITATSSGFTLNRILLLIRYFWRNKIKKVSIPQVITVGVTYSCQCKCVHCSSGIPNIKQSKEEKKALKDQEMTTLQIKDLINQSVKMGIPRITFFGGEPLMRKDIFELINYAYSKGMITRINTNCFALNEDVVKRLKMAGLTHCDVSIDDPNPEVHDKLRGIPGLFDRVINGIHLLNKYKILCQIVTYAGKRNVTEGLKKIIKLGRELHVLGVSIVFPMATGCWFESFDELLNEEEKEKVRKLADAKFVHIEIPTSKDMCNVLKKSSLYISPEGNLSPCPFIPWAFGNCKKQKIEKLVTSFYAELNINYTGDCIMNNPDTRNLLTMSVKKIKETHDCIFSSE